MVGLAVGAGLLMLADAGVRRRAGRRRDCGGRRHPAGRAGSQPVLEADPAVQRLRAYGVHRRSARPAYLSDEETLSKGDNNVFRMVWWRAAVEETIEGNLWFGLGFGHDLAFVSSVNIIPTTRGVHRTQSHNVLITIFARMGLVGSVAFLALLVACAGRTLWVLRHAAPLTDAGAFWCAAWVLLICACFGVVLEGPMGAVVFWTMLGLASATSAAEREQRNEENAASADAGPAAVDAPPATA